MYNVPDFSGRYEGTLQYEYRDENCQIQKGTLEHTKIIKQTGSAVVIRSFTKRIDGSLSSESLSKEASIVKEPDGVFSLLYNYLNDGDSNQQFPPHYGTEILKLIIDGNNKHLVGRYYTERLPFGTKGKIDVKFQGNNVTPLK
jgi:hypothetical protein